MFTEGLDESALNWVREGAEVQPNAFPSENISPNLVADPIIIYGTSRAKTDNWGLPAIKLPGLHYHSGLLSSLGVSGNAIVDEDDESVGSAPGDSYDRDFEYSTGSGEGRDSRYSVDSELQENPLLHHYRRDVEHEGDGHGYPCDRHSELNSDSIPKSDSGSREIKPRVHLDPGGDEFRFSHKGQRPCSDAGSPEDAEYLGQHVREDNGHCRSCQKFSWKPSHGHSASSGEELGQEVNQSGQNDLHSSRALPSEPDLQDRGCHVIDIQPRGLSDMGRPSAPPMVEPGAEITEASNQKQSVSASLSGSTLSTTDGNFKTELKGSCPQGLAESIPSCNVKAEQIDSSAQETNDEYTRPTIGEEEVLTSCRQTDQISHPPTVYLSGHGAWQAFIAYDACVRLCLRAWAKGCMEAPEFLRDECVVLRNAFGLQKILLQPQEELRGKGATANSVEESSAPKLKKTVGKIKVEVHKLVVASGCSFPCVGPILQHLKSLGSHFSNIRSALLAGWAAVRNVRVVPRAPLSATRSQYGATKMQAGAHYVRQVSGLLKAGLNAIRNNPLTERAQEAFSCLIQLKSSIEDETVRMRPGSAVWMQPGSGAAHVFFPENTGDSLVLEVQDSKGNAHGRVQIQISSITDDLSDRVRWWPIYSEPEHECVGKVQLSINWVSTSGEMGPTKCCVVGETLAYDVVLEAAMRVQHFQSRNLRLHGPWKWLLMEFASFYGVSDSYTKLRYLACIMGVATPTKDCFELVYELLVPIMKARDENTLNRQEKRMLGEIEDQVKQLLAAVFENYKSLDELAPSGLLDMFRPATGIPAPALVPAVQTYSLLHDILSPEAQSTLRNYLQTAARKRWRWHMAETDEFMSGNNEGFLMDPLTISTAYLKMKALCLHIRNEMQTDIQIHNQHILPSFIDLPNIGASVYNLELCNRLRAFLVACPPSSPSAPVTELLITTADFQRDLASWNICPVKGGVDSKDLFHLYIVLWIQDKRLLLLDFCKLEKVRWAEATPQHSTSPFVEEVYERIKDAVNEYEVIINRWPEYSFALENAITDVERAVVTALEKQYADVLTPLKDNMITKKLGLQYMQKLRKRHSICLYTVSNQLGPFLNTMKRILDVLHPRVETQLRSWSPCLLGTGDKKMVFGEQLNAITVMLRAKYKNFLQAIVEKLVDNTQVQRTTKLKRILQDAKEAGGENEIRERMQPLNTQLMETICHLHGIFSSRIFVAICRGLWDRMGQDVLYFLENRKENRSWYKGSCFALGILDDTFASQMQRLQGHALQEKDLDPPRSVMEARSMLCRDTAGGADSSSFYYF